MADEERDYGFAVFILRVAFIGGLAIGGWLLFRSPSMLNEDKSPSSSPPPIVKIEKTHLQISLSGENSNAEENSVIEKEASIVLSPIDLASVEREFSRREVPNLRLEDFVRRRLHGQAVISGKFDENGQASFEVAPGQWWIYAAHRTGERDETSWRVPLNVRGREQKITLTPGNAYARGREF